MTYRYSMNQADTDIPIDASLLQKIDDKKQRLDCLQAAPLKMPRNTCSKISDFGIPITSDAIAREHSLTLQETKLVLRKKASPSGENHSKTISKHRNDPRRHSILLYNSCNKRHRSPKRPFNTFIESSPKRRDHSTHS